MSLEGMQEAWGSLEEHARSFRGMARESLLTGQALEELPEELVGDLDLLLESSEKLRRHGDLALRDGEEYERVSTLILGAAAVDAMLARDLSMIEPGLDHNRFQAWFESRGERTEDEDPASVFEEGEELLGEVGQLFGEAPQQLAGRSPFPDRPALVSETKAAIEGLVGLATNPASDLARGLVTVAVAASGELLSAAMHLDVVAELERSGERLGTHAPRFLREHVTKVATLRSDDRIVDELAEKVGEEIEKRASGPAADLLRFVSAPADAAAYAENRVDHASEVTQEKGDALLADLTALQTKYREQMSWIGKSALWLRRGARLLVHLGAVAVGPLSYAIGAGVFFVGFSYVGYSLADRIDARDLGFADRVEGVIRLVDRHIPPDQTSPGTLPPT